MVIIAKRNVLIVDDNAINRTILERILKGNYNIISAENGKTAMDILTGSQIQIDAVLLDIVMPVMDGYEVLSAIRSDMRFHSLPVIVTTQESGEESEIKALSMGANDFLTKPYKPEIIRHRLDNVILMHEHAAFINNIEKDSLTGVYSKDFFYSKVGQIIAASPLKKYDLICVDIQRFKLINELFGTSLGDELLRRTAQSLKEFTDCCQICGRVASDVFIVLTEHNDNYSDDIFLLLEKNLQVFFEKIRLSLRFGVYVIDDVSVSVSAMCDRARIACGSVKGKYGKIYAVYDDTDRKKLLDEQFILDNMNQGIENREFVVYYQPKFDLNSEEIVGAPFGLAKSFLHNCLQKFTPQSQASPLC